MLNLLEKDKKGSLPRSLFLFNNLYMEIQFSILLSHVSLSLILLILILFSLLIKLTLFLLLEFSFILSGLPKLNIQRSQR